MQLSDHNVYFNACHMIVNYEITILDCFNNYEYRFSCYLRKTLSFTQYCLHFVKVYLCVVLRKYLSRESSWTVFIVILHLC